MTKFHLRTYKHDNDERLYLHAFCVVEKPNHTRISSVHPDPFRGAPHTDLQGDARTPMRIIAAMDKLGSVGRKVSGDVLHCIFRELQAHSGLIRNWRLAQREETI